MMTAIRRVVFLLTAAPIATKAGPVSEGFEDFDRFEDAARCSTGMHDVYAQRKTFPRLVPTRPSCLVVGASALAALTVPINEWASLRAFSRDFLTSELSLPPTRWSC